MTRTFTPDQTIIKPGPDGTVRKTTRIHVKRVCNICHENVGDVTEAELDAAIAGLPLPAIENHHCQEQP
ncbi:hypothetical protein SEA_SONALI_71 [Arthrobacter phage Sonali]|uniref:Uncharacterized protein n=1 Tax=Arthrobacter phage Sonali TaxID=2510495 RepID=A0A411CR09_9CAUD|nr:hypothetical protein HOV09_gp71 [Arthrobacter phage Sonali]QAY16183.1 hypothetical protein SEA_SONALI_71 [Arthrobacter phage Sonali]